MTTQPDGQTALHLAAEEAKLDCTMLEVRNKSEADFMTIIIM